jgi:type I restriction enzyme S subunit
MSNALTHIDNKPSLRASHCEDEGRRNLKQSQPLVPALRFREFEGEWKKNYVNDLASKLNVGFVGTCEPYYTTSEEGVLLVRTGNLKGVHIELNEEKYVTRAFHDKNKKSQINPGDLLLARHGGNGEICRVPDGFPMANCLNIVILRTSSELKSEYFQLVYSSFAVQKQISAVTAGSTQGVINTKEIGKLKVVHPSLPEQQKIASFLSAVDEKIQQLTKKKALLEQYKKGVMQELFSGQLRFKDEKGKDYPDWEESSVIDIADKKVKWSFTGGPFGSDLKSDDYTETGIRVIQLQNIGDGIFHDKSKIYTSIEKADQLLACNILAGEMILSKMGDPVARACMIPETDERWLMCSDGIRYVVDENKVNKIYLFEYINSSFFRKKALALSTGSTRKRIGLSELKKIKISHPCLNEQTKIGLLLDSLGINIESVTTQITQSQTFKKGLLQQMFV